VSPVVGQVLFGEKWVDEVFRRYNRKLLGLFGMIRLQINKKMLFFLVFQTINELY